MTRLGPELRRAMATAILRGALGREPQPVEVLQALHGCGDSNDTASFAQHVGQWVARRIAVIEADRASLQTALASSQTSLLDAEASLAASRMALSSVLSSTSWRLTEPLRRMMDQAASLKARLHRNGMSAAEAAAAEPPPDPIAVAARRNAAIWCAHDTPAVSVIIATCAVASRTADCVRHVWAFTAGLPYEVILVDGTGGDHGFADLLDISGTLRIITVGAARFIGEACNIGAEAARGDHVCFLSSGSRPGEGWLTTLHAAMRDDPAIGAAAAQQGDDDILRALKSRRRGGCPARDDATVAAMLVDRQAFLHVGGFDLAYEPGPFGDLDLRFKLHLIGRPTRFCPQATLMPADQQAPDPTEASQRHITADLNAGKLLERWADWLDDPSPERAEAMRRELIPTALSRANPPGARPVVAIFTPFMLTPGGGERVILTLASVLSQTCGVELVTLHRYSRLRVANLAKEFSLDLSRCALATMAEFQSRPGPDVWIALGNHLFPSVGPAGRLNWYLCQFPFPMPRATAEAWRGNLSGYDVILTYSDFVRSHVQAGLAARQVLPIATEVVYPPVVLQRGDAAAKQPMILSVGRFIAGGHTKRHDALIDAFRVLFHRFGGGIEYHIVGSSFPTPEDMAYLAALQASAADLPVIFHVNAKEHTLEALYRQAMFYWHATGYGLQASAAPERAEHFGISIVEAMSAGCVPMAFASGGPCEIIQHGRTGFLFETLDELVERTARLMQPARSGDRIGMGRAAADAARRFSPDAFAARIAQLSDTYPGDAAAGDHP